MTHKGALIIYAKLRAQIFKCKFLTLKLMDFARACFGLQSSILKSAIFPFQVWVKIDQCSGIRTRTVDFTSRNLQFCFQRSNLNSQRFAHVHRSVSIDFTIEKYTTLSVHLSMNGSSGRSFTFENIFFVMTPVIGGFMFPSFLTYFLILNRFWIFFFTFLPLPLPLQPEPRALTFSQFIVVFVFFFSIIIIIIFFFCCCCCFCKWRCRLEFVRQFSSFSFLWSFSSSLLSFCAFDQ